MSLTTHYIVNTRSCFLFVCFSFLFLFCLGGGWVFFFFVKLLESGDSLQLHIPLPELVKS